MTRLMEMMGLGFMPRIVLEGGGGGGGGGGPDTSGDRDTAEQTGLSITGYSRDKGEIGGVADAMGNVATGDELIANVARAKARSTAAKDIQAAKANPKDTAAVAKAQASLDAYDQAVQTAKDVADKSLAASNPNPELAAFRPKSRPKSVEAKAKAIADKKAADARAATIAATAKATGLTKEAVEANINSATNTDDKWGYTKPDGTPVSAFNDRRDGGGINSAGAGFARSGGRAADTNADGFVTAEEAEAVGGLQGNFASSISNSIGATPYGSGLAPTGIARALSFTGPGLIYGALRDVGRGSRRQDKGYTAPGPGYTVQGQSEVSGSSDPSLVDEGMPTDGIVRENIYSTRPTSETYTRRYKGGGMGAYSPSYLRQYASGRKINELVREVTLADGSKAYLTPDGKYLEMDQFDNTATGSQTEIDTGTERYVSGYRMTDSDGNVTEYDAAGNIVYPSLYPELEGVDFKVPNVGDQIPGYSEPELNYDPDQLTPLPNPYPELFEPGGPYSEPFLNYDPDQLVPLPNPYPELFDPDYVRSPPRAGFDPNNPGSGI